MENNVTHKFYCRVHVTTIRHCSNVLDVIFINYYSRKWHCCLVKIRFWRIWVNNYTTITYPCTSSSCVVYPSHFEFQLIVPIHDSGVGTKKLINKYFISIKYFNSNVSKEVFRCENIKTLYRVLINRLISTREFFFECFPEKCTNVVQNT